MFQASLDHLHRILQEPLVVLTGILAIGILAQWLAWKLRLPSILLLLASGSCLRYFGGTDPDVLIGQTLLFPIVSMGVAVIMFEGGLTLDLREIASSRSVVVRLVTVGALVTGLLSAVFAWFLFEMDWRIAAMVGAILVVTGPTVVIPLLRHVRPSRRIAAVIKWEGIVIDPVGATLAVIVYTALLASAPMANSETLLAHSLLVAWMLARTILVGVVLAAFGTWLLITAIHRYWMPDFLHNPISLAVALVLFTLSNQLQDESGLLTVTLLGILMANQRKVNVHHLVEFKENLGVLVISCLFILLAARIRISQIADLGWQGPMYLLALILLVRPLAVWLSTMFSELTTKERIFLAFLAPRGIVAAAVSAVFAIHIAAHDLEDAAAIDPITASAAQTPAVQRGPKQERADVIAAHIEKVPKGTEDLVPVTFLVIVGSVLFYGLLAVPLARRLGLSERDPQGLLIAGAAPWAQEIAEAIIEEGFDVHLVDTNFRNISTARQKGVPATCASILSEFVLEELELSGIGRFLALTANDDLNRLATIAVARDMDQSNVFQLVPWQPDGGSPRLEPHAKISKGRLVFAPGVNFGEMARRDSQGAEIKHTKITDEFTADDFHALYDNSLILFAVRAEKLIIATVETPIDPKSGDTLIALVATHP